MPKQKTAQKPDPAAALITTFLSLYITFPLKPNAAGRDFAF